MIFLLYLCIGTVLCYIYSIGNFRERVLSKTQMIGVIDLSIILKIQIINLYKHPRFVGKRNRILLCTPLLSLFSKYSVKTVGVSLLKFCVQSVIKVHDELLLPFKDEW